MMFKAFYVAAGLAAAAFAAPASAADISGAGATFPYPIYAKWADAYKKETDIGLNYQSIGSGGGIKQIQAKTVTFGATDAPLKGAQLEKDGLVQFPMVMGGLVLVANLDGITPGQLVLDGPTARQDLPRRDQDLGRRRDRQAQSRREAAEPADPRRAPLRRLGHHVRVHRLPRQGQPGLEGKVGSSTAVEWPVGIGAKGNEGVANNVMQTKGSIGYVEYAYAKQNKLTHTRMINAAGKTVEPSTPSFQAAAAAADWKSQPGLRHRPEQPARRRRLADHLADLHPDPQAAEGPGRGRRRAQVLRLGLHQGRQDGRRPRLHPDARGRREDGRGQLDADRQTRQRQAPLAGHELSDAADRGSGCSPVPFCPLMASQSCRGQARWSLREDLSW